MKTIEVTVVRRLYTTYEIQVEDDFDVNGAGARDYVENTYIRGDWGSEDEVTYEEVANWDIDYIGEVK